MMPNESAPAAKIGTGLSFWMEKVVQDCARLTQEFAPDAVHDLRVALRRCRSIADGFMAFDPHHAWTDMRKEGTRLFKRLGDLRDTQVMMEWLRNPGAPPDGASRILLEHLSVRERELRVAAADALAAFNQKKWIGHSSQLARRACRIPAEGAAFCHLALERWHQARQLHRQALRNRSHIAYHRLRIALKRFRYTAENFLPALHDRWIEGLRELQDLLGEMHDLHVLMQKAIELGAVRDEETRSHWRSWINGEIQNRLERYRSLMIGADSLWWQWRTGLPDGEALQSAVMTRLDTWASFRDPERAHSKHVMLLALQLYDSLRGTKVGLAGTKSERAILRASSLLHAIGLARQRKGHHKAAYRMLRKVGPPLGWDADDFIMASLVVRHHRGALPRSTRATFRCLSREKQRMTITLAGILRLGEALADSQKNRISWVKAERSEQSLTITAAGYRAYSSHARKLAAARHLLELTCGVPVIIRSE